MYIYIIYIYFCLKSESNPFWMFSCFMSVLEARMQCTLRKQSWFATS